MLHSEIVPQFADPKNRSFNFDNFAPGLYAFARGLVKKVIIADTFAVAVDAGFASALTLNTAEAWFVAIGYTLQLYFDFSGYTDMAIGGPDLRLPLAGKLQLSLHFQVRLGVLAPLAHDAVFLVPGLCVHPPGRKPLFPGPPDSQSDGGVDADGVVAWLRVELRALGPFTMPCC